MFNIDFGARSILISAIAIIGVVFLLWRQNAKIETLTGELASSKTQLEQCRRDAELASQARNQGQRYLDEQREGVRKYNESKPKPLSQDGRHGSERRPSIFDSERRPSIFDGDDSMRNETDTTASDSPPGSQNPKAGKTPASKGGWHDKVKFW